MKNCALHTEEKRRHCDLKWQKTGDKDIRIRFCAHDSTKLFSQILSSYPEYFNSIALIAKKISKFFELFCADELFWCYHKGTNYRVF